MNILSMVDTKTQKEMTNSKREKLPKVELNCVDDSKLSILTKEELGIISQIFERNFQLKYFLKSRRYNRNGKSKKQE